MAEYTNEQILEGLEQVRALAESRGYTEAQHIQLITQKAREGGLSLKRLSEATGQSMDAINSAIAGAQDSGQNIPQGNVRGEYTNEQIKVGLEQLRAVAEERGYTEAQHIQLITQTAVNNGLPLSRIAEATDFNDDDVNRAVNYAQSQGAGTQIPGDLRIAPQDHETAITEGVVRARNALGDSTAAAKTAVNAGTEAATNQLAPYAASGVQANDKLAALQGLLGPEAQQQAFSQFSESPQQAYLREQGERAVVGNASAIGGLGGGNVRRELLRQGIGLAAQDYGNYSGRLENTRANGLGASTNTADLLSQEGRDIAGIEGKYGESVSRLEDNAGTNLSASRLANSQLLSNQNFQGNMQQALFDQQDKNSAVNAIGAGGSDISGQINNAAGNNANLNTYTAEQLEGMRRLGINNIPNLEAGGAISTANGTLAGANIAADTGKDAANIAMKYLI